MYLAQRDGSLHLQLSTRGRTCIIPLRGASDIVPPRSALGRLGSGINDYGAASHKAVHLVDSIEMMHGRVHRAVHESSSQICLRLSGDFDIYNKRELAATLASYVAYPAITIDLAQTRFIDGGIIGVFARFATLRRELGGAQLRIVNCNTFMFKLFSICRLDTLFCIEEQRHA